jgi:hypothetical protein
MACDILNIFQKSDPDQILNLSVAILEHTFDGGKQLLILGGVALFVGFDDIVGKLPHRQIPRRILTLPV